MPPASFGLLTAIGTVAFYAATGAVVFYGRQRSLFSAALALAADRPVLAALALLGLVGLGLLADTVLSRLLSAG